MSNEASAAELLQCARHFRQSTAANGVYVNAHLTPAESLAAFQERERRRARRYAQDNSGLASTSVPGEAAKVDNSSLSLAFVSQTETVVNTAQLSVSDFVPPSSSPVTDQQHGMVNITAAATDSSPSANTEEILLVLIILFKEGGITNCDINRTVTGIQKQICNKILTQHLLRCCLFNACSLTNKLPDLHYVLYSETEFDCLLITESWLTDEITDGMLDPESKYHILRCDRKVGRGGGVCAFIRGVVFVLCQTVSWVLLMDSKYCRLMC